MREYQQKYIENTEKTAAILSKDNPEAPDFEAFFCERMQKEQELLMLKKENTALLSEHLFPMLDSLYQADESDIRDLEEFADRLMDWRVNLDIGIYVVIHDALLSLARFKKDRDRIIMELYKLGMVNYYLNRTMQGIDRKLTRSFHFNNEMLFTEAGSYLKFFADIEKEETKGYIIRSLANISIATPDRKRRVEVTSRILRLLQDPWYRELAPGLPWERFLRASYQQMSANRSMMSRGELSAAELSEILDACAVVFEPEKDRENPNIRWLWPYYEMEYTCGFANLSVTRERLERLIMSQPYDQADVSGLYGNVQLPIYYGNLIEKNPVLLDDPKNRHFLARAYQKMMKTVLSFPPELYDDYFRYEICLILSTYYETDGVPSFRSISEELMKRLFTREYLEGRKCGELMAAISETILEQDPGFFDDILFIRDISDPERKKAAVLEFARDCGLYHDFGLLKMNLARTMASRNLFENEYQIMTLHTEAGREDLGRCRSTERLSDTAFGHHAFYNSAGGYPAEYRRNRSDYRMMTDVAAVTVFLIEGGFSDVSEGISELYRLEGTRFSPMVTRVFNTESLRERIREILFGDEKCYYREIYESFVKN